jgi:hypothetical protein
VKYCPAPRLDELVEVHGLADEGRGVGEDRLHGAVEMLLRVTQRREDRAIKAKLLDAFGRGEVLPAHARWDAVLALQLGHHLEEQQVGQLGDVLLVSDAVFAQQGAKPPKLVHEIGRGIHARIPVDERMLSIGTPRSEAAVESLSCITGVIGAIM